MAGIVTELYNAKIEAIRQRYELRLSELGLNGDQSFQEILYNRVSAEEATAASPYAAAASNAGGTSGSSGDMSQMYSLMANSMVADSLGSLLGGDSGSSGSSMSSMAMMMMMNNMLGQQQSAQAQSGSYGVNGVQGAAGAYQSASTASVPTEYESLIQQAAARYGINPALVKGVMMSESSFRNDVVSSAGAQGLMQLMPGTAAYLGVNDPFDPAQNIDGGVRYLREMLDKYNGDVRMALAAYNCGPGRVSELGVTSSSNETFQNLPDNVEAYVERVLRYTANYEQSGVSGMA